MKIKICHLGAIGEAEIELKPLTVFIGGNGLGKTWTAYSLAAILGTKGYEKYVEAYIDGQTEQKYPPLDAAIQELIASGNARVDLWEFADIYAEAYINDVASLASSWLLPFMAGTKSSVCQVQIGLGKSKTELLNKIKGDRAEKKLYVGSKGAVLNLLKEADESIIYFYLLSEREIWDRVPQRVVKQFVIAGILQRIHVKLCSHLYTFPTERTTFISLPLPEKVVPESRVRNLLAPVGDFLEMMETAENRNFAEREMQINEEPRIGEYVKLAALLENDILQGQVDYERSGLKKQLLFQVADGLKLEMPIVSAMVKELAPLVLYLRYLAAPDDWLIIDEPEINLHPAAQVEIIEFLAMLVRGGLHVILTTHSPYIVAHLANLIQASKRPDREKIKERFYLERTEAFIAQEQVSVYLFAEGTATNVLAEDGSIDWSTFGNVSDDISHIFS